MSLTPSSAASPFVCGRSCGVQAVPKMRNSSAIVSHLRTLVDPDIRHKISPLWTQPTVVPGSHLRSPAMVASSWYSQYSHFEPWGVCGNLNSGGPRVCCLPVRELRFGLLPQ